MTKPLVAILLTSLVSFFPGTNMAQAGTTQLKFVINPNLGGLSISVPAEGIFASLLSPDTLTVVSLQLEYVTVTDTRRNLVNPLIRAWTTDAIATDFISGTDSLTASSIGYSAGPATILSGSAGVTETTRETLLNTVPVQTGASTTGNHVVRWRPTLTIAVPGLKSQGEYRGSLTHSVS